MWWMLKIWKLTWRSTGRSQWPYSISSCQNYIQLCVPTGVSRGEVPNTQPTGSSKGASRGGLEPSVGLPAGEDGTCLTGVGYIRGASDRIMDTLFDDTPPTRCCDWPDNSLMSDGCTRDALSTVTNDIGCFRDAFAEWSSYTLSPHVA